MSSSIDFLTGSSVELLPASGTGLLYPIRRWWRSMFPLPMWHLPCCQCNGCGGSGGCTGDGFNEPREWEFTPCPSCADEGVCPSCSTNLDDSDSDRMFSSGCEPCPFCKWTVDTGVMRDAGVDSGDDSDTFGDLQYETS